MTMAPSCPVEEVSPSSLMARINRFQQLWIADQGFRKEAIENPDSRQGWLDKARVGLSASQLDFLWPLLEGETGQFGDAHFVRDQLASTEIGRLWIDWNQKRAQHFALIEKRRLSSGIARLDKWRARQIARVNSESYVQAYNFAPPLFAFELASGCSRQCWFCGFAPDDLAGVWRYTSANEMLWRELITTLSGKFGPALETAVLYHATEPTDNPDYLSFLNDFFDIVGSLPQTTTVQPLKDIEWTRRIIEMRKRDDGMVDRFSVLTLASLYRVFEVFSPEELMRIHFSLMNKGSLQKVNQAGNALKRRVPIHPVTGDQSSTLTQAPSTQSTLECVIGYLVNMVDGTIKLISPCNASPEQPKGYQIHAQGKFTDVKEFMQFVDSSMEACMSTSFRSKDVVTLRPDLKLSTEASGFIVESRYRRHEVKGNGHFALLGQLIAEGRHTGNDIIERMNDAGMNYLSAIAWLDKLYDRGLFVENANRAEHGGL